MQLELSKLERQRDAIRLAVSKARVEGALTDEMLQQLEVANEILESARADNELTGKILDNQISIADALKDQKLDALEVAKQGEIKAAKEAAFAGSAEAAAGSLQRQVASSAAVATNIERAAVAATKMASGFSQANTAAQGLGTQSIGAGRTFEGFDQEAAMQYALSKNSVLGEAVTIPGTGETIYQRKVINDFDAQLLGVNKLREANIDLMEAKVEYFEKVQQGFQLVDGKWQSVAEEIEDVTKASKDLAEASEMPSPGKTMQDDIAAAKEEQRREEDRHAAKVQSWGEDELEQKKKVGEEAYKQMKTAKAIAEIMSEMGMNNEKAMRTYLNLQNHLSDVSKGTAKSVLMDTDQMLEKYRELARLYERSIGQSKKPQAQGDYVSKDGYYNGMAPGQVRAGTTGKGHNSAGGGQAGSVGVPSINFTGQTLNFEGDKYIKTADIPGLINVAVLETAKNLSRKPSLRLQTGAY